MRFLLLPLAALAIPAQAQTPLTPGIWTNVEDRAFAVEEGRETPPEMAFRIGEDGRWLIKVLQDAGADTSMMIVSDNPSGHANIQVNSSGENAIVLFGGTNRQISVEDATTWLSAIQLQQGAK